MHMTSSRIRLTSSNHHTEFVSYMKLGVCKEAKKYTRITTSNTDPSSEVTRLLFLEITSILYQKDTYE